MPRLILPHLLALPLLLAQPVFAQGTGYTVVDTRTIDINIGVGGTAALISPDGTKILHVDKDEHCLFELGADGEWVVNNPCISADALPFRGTDDMYWSPDSTRLIEPTYETALVYFRESDLAVFEASTFARTVLTEDGLEGNLLDDRVQLDLAGHWIDDDQIAFIRYNADKGESEPVRLMRISNGEVPEEIAIVSVDKLSVTTIAVSADGKWIAYPQGYRAGEIDIYVVNVENGSIVKIADNLPKEYGATSGLGFSADGRFLGVLGFFEDGNRVTVIDLQTWEIRPIATEATVSVFAWSPEGATMAYLALDRGDDTRSGLYLVDLYGGEAEQLLSGAYIGPTPRLLQPMIWAKSGAMVLGDRTKGGTLVVTLAPSGVTTPETAGGTEGKSKG